MYYVLYMFIILPLFLLMSDLHHVLPSSSLAESSAPLQFPDSITCYPPVPRLYHDITCSPPVPRLYHVLPSSSQTVSRASLCSIDSDICHCIEQYIQQYICKRVDGKYAHMNNNSSCITLTVIENHNMIEEIRVSIIIR